MPLVFSFLRTPFDGKRFSFKGGGTSFKPVFEYVAKECEQPDLLIYFTDGFGDVPEKPAYPVMRVIAPGGKKFDPLGIGSTNIKEGNFKSNSKNGEDGIAKR